jgi:hypothetical protein
MLKMVVTAAVVFVVLYIAAEIGDRHGFSPLSKIARAFDSMPAVPNPPVSAPPAGTAGDAPAESVVA